jgi:hypothetical protein
MVGIMVGNPVGIMAGGSGELNLFLEDNIK